MNEPVILETTYLPPDIPDPSGWPNVDPSGHRGPPSTRYTRQINSCCDEGCLECLFLAMREVEVGTWDDDDGPSTPDSFGCGRDRNGQIDCENRPVATPESLPDPCECPDEWRDDDLFIGDLITMLDNVLQHFIDNTFKAEELNKTETNYNFEDFKNNVKEESLGFTKAAYSAYRERAVGLGAMGFCSYLQRNGICFESMYATSFNHRSFSHIKNKAVEASKRLAEERGEAPDMVGSGLRNSHLLAIAPNASSSIICGGTSPSVEPQRANIFTHKTLTGSYKVKNKYLEALLKKKGINNEKTWKDIAAHEGSVQHLDELSEEEKEIFRTAPELNQLWVIEHAHQRQQYICQSQSVNLFFTFPKATEPQDVHDSYLEYVNSVHWAGANKLKSLYYLRSDAARAAENVNIKIPKINLEDMECLSCEG